MTKHKHSFPEEEEDDNDDDDDEEEVEVEDASEKKDQSAQKISVHLIIYFFMLCISMALVYSLTIWIIV